MRCCFVQEKVVRRSLYSGRDCTSVKFNFRDFRCDCLVCVTADFMHMQTDHKEISHISHI
jgi:hypothetical protein